MDVAGAKIFAAYSCNVCHSERGPSMAGLYGRDETVWAGSPDQEQKVKADEAYLRESILYPRAKIVKGYDPSLMPSYQGQLSEEQVNQLIAYIKTLQPVNPGNSMDLGIKMQEQNTQKPYMRSRNSDGSKRDYE